MPHQDHEDTTRREGQPREGPLRLRFSLDQLTAAGGPPLPATRSREEAAADDLREQLRQAALGESVLGGASRIEHAALVGLAGPTGARIMEAQLALSDQLAAMAHQSEADILRMQAAAGAGGAAAAALGSKLMNMAEGVPGPTAAVLGFQAAAAAGGGMGSGTLAPLGFAEVFRPDRFDRLDPLPVPRPAARSCPIPRWADHAERRLADLVRIAPQLESGPELRSLRDRCVHLRRDEDELRAAERRQPRGSRVSATHRGAEGDYLALLGSIRGLEAEAARMAAPAAALAGPTAGGSPGPVAALSPPPTLDNDAMLSPAQLAAIFHLGQDTTEKRLGRWRQRNAGSRDWIEHDGAKPREPRFFYRLGAVRTLLAKSSREPSRERPAKRTGTT